MQIQSISWIGSNYLSNGHYCPNNIVFKLCSLKLLPLEAHFLRIWEIINGCVFFKTTNSTSKSLMYNVKYNLNFSTYFTTWFSLGGWLSGWRANLTFSSKTKVLEWISMGFHRDEMFSRMHHNLFIVLGRKLPNTLQLLTPTWRGGMHSLSPEGKADLFRWL